MYNGLDAAAATEQLYELYKGDIYKYARFSLGSPLDAEDVVQDVFIQVLRKWHQFRGEASPKTWLWAITRSSIIDRARKIKKYGREVPNHDGQEPSAEEQSYQTIETEQLLTSLPENYRQVIVLRILQDMSTMDTAYILGWSESKVKVTLHRAIEKLRIQLNANPDGRKGSGNKL